MSVLVTGASGHIGGNLVRALLDQGREIKVVVREDSRAIQGLDVQKINADVLDYDSLLKACNGADVIYHLAAKISITGEEGGAVHQVNVIGTRNVVRACLESGVKRLIHFSSIHALCCMPPDKPVDESNFLSDGDRALPYDKSKALGEKEVMAGVNNGLDAVILRPTGVLGPHDYKPSAMGEVFLLLHKRKIPALVEGGFNWTDVRDVVQGAIAAEQKGRTGEAYILSGTWLSFGDMAVIFEEITGVKTPKWMTPMWLARLGAPFVTMFNKLIGKRPLYTNCSLDALCWNRQISHAKATKELNYSPRPIRETIVDSVNWFKKAGMI